MALKFDQIATNRHLGDSEFRSDIRYQQKTAAPGGLDQTCMPYFRRHPRAADGLSDSQTHNSNEQNRTCYLLPVKHRVLTLMAHPPRKHKRNVSNTSTQKMFDFVHLAIILA
jgi:hypothetical protein